MLLSVTTRRRSSPPLITITITFIIITITIITTTTTHHHHSSPLISPARSSQQLCSHSKFTLCSSEPGRHAVCALDDFIHFLTTHIYATRCAISMTSFTFSLHKCATRSGALDDFIHFLSYYTNMQHDFIHHLTTRRSLEPGHAGVHCRFPTITPIIRL